MSTRVVERKLDYLNLKWFDYKPVGLTQWEFRYCWLYGLVEPRTRLLNTLSIGA